MQDILFREKVIDENNEWVYGFLISDNVIRQTKETIPYNHSMCGVGDFYIDRETLGQYIGLCDENEVKMFEGDIVDVEYDINYVGVASERIGLFYIVFDDGCFMKRKNQGGLFHFIPSDRCRVVGNIYDNPEILN